MIRLATEKNIESIKKIGLLYNDNFNNMYDIKYYLNDLHSTIYVSADNLGINGFLISQGYEENVDLLLIVVDIHNRNRGIGSKLMEKFINDNKEKNVLLEVNVNNYVAIKLYRNFGFDVINVRKKYYGNDDAYLMKR